MQSRQLGSLAANAGIWQTEQATISLGILRNPVLLPRMHWVLKFPRLLPNRQYFLKVKSGILAAGKPTVHQA